MEFLKERVYTALNAEELKVGSKVIVADSLAYLKKAVESDNQSLVYIIDAILTDDNLHRFVTENRTEWALAYLVSEPEEKKLKWTDLKIGDVIRKKYDDGYRYAMVVRIDTSTTDKHINIPDEWLSDLDLGNWEEVEE